jgi:hypothetical protein
MDADDLRDGIFALNTRRFGTVAELLVQRLIDLGKGRSLFHDLYDEVKSRRVEVKFSRVLKQSEVTVSKETVLQCIQDASSERRMVRFDEWQQSTFDCNIQQIKRAEFDSLYYGLFFAECATIFHIESSQIGPRIYYSDKQHTGNIGEGQFHVNQDTLQVHLDNYLYRTLTYDVLLELLTP